MLNDATKLSHIDDTGDVSITSSSLLSALSLGSQSLAWFHSYLIYDTHCSPSDSPVLPSSGVLQGPSLGSTTFLTYTEDTAVIVSLHLLQCHLYADDTQSYLWYPAVRSCLTSSVNDLAKSYATLRLHLTHPQRSSSCTWCNLNKKHKNTCHCAMFCRCTLPWHLSSSFHRLWSLWHSGAIQIRLLLLLLLLLLDSKLSHKTAYWQGRQHLLLPAEKVAPDS